MTAFDKEIKLSKSWNLARSCSTISVSSCDWCSQYNGDTTVESWLNWSVLLCEGYLDEHTTGIHLWTEPSGRGTRSFVLDVVLCQHSTLVDLELLNMLNACDIPFCPFQRSPWDSAATNCTHWRQLYTPFCIHGYICMCTNCSSSKLRKNAECFALIFLPLFW
jgi:hypothetical protein